MSLTMNMQFVSPTPLFCLPVRAVLVLIALAAGMHVSHAEDKSTQPAERPALGAQGEEGTPMRRQDWRVPTPISGLAARATLFRPTGNGPFRLALIAHASTQSALQRAQVPMPEYRGLVGALVARGYAVLVPQRPGHGATGGPYLEDQKGCLHADYVPAGERTADSIEAALRFAQAQSFIKRDGALVIGHSAGGWGALALAARKPRSVALIIVFAPGRGGRAEGMANSVCAADRLIAAAGVFGKSASAEPQLSGAHARGTEAVPVTWIVADNDSYFSPQLSKAMADAFASTGAKVDFRLVPAFGRDGHGLAETNGLDLLMRFVIE